MTEASKEIPPKTIRAHLLPGASIQPSDFIRSAEIKRDWMDNVPMQYVYRCIPLLAANSMGWELLNPIESEIVWHGRAEAESLEIRCERRNKFSACSHFGSGMVTWYVPFLFKSSPDLGLFVTGPSNHDHNHAVPLEAFIRTDWLPFPFTMNWRLTQPGKPALFKKGEPIARIMPFPIQMLEETSLEIVELQSDPGFMAEVNQFGRARQQNVAKQQTDAHRAAQTGEALKGEGVWNSQYVRAKGKENGGFVPHQTIFHSPKPIDKTGSQ